LIKSKNDRDVPNGYFNTATSKPFFSAENPFLLEDNILYLILIGKRNFHTYLISD
jgi:hypothetical protein